ncbi:MAG: NADH-quinone oxidoreductase subunit NuoK [Planctomycetaceae bacterium]|nr:NADH-quinone oxidoreductase subunit NuoK [Planctomycetaceae bacterium]
MNEVSLLYNFLLVGGLLFVLGMIGFLVRRNMIVMFLCAEMMLQGVSVTLIGFGRHHGGLVESATSTAASTAAASAGPWGGQMLVIFIIAVAACEAGIAMALVLMLYRQSGTLDAAYWQDLREETLPPFVDREVPEERQEDRVWPRLTPSGVEPPIDPDELLHRPRV